MSEFWGDLLGMADGSVLQTHDEGMCAGDTCCIHKPSDHPLNKAPLRWRWGTMYRVCPCGVPHPDPDHIDFTARRHGVQWALLEASHLCCPQNCCDDGSPSGEQP